MIMATIIKRTDSLTELPLTTALTGRASPQGEAENSGRAKPSPPRGSLFRRRKNFLRKILQIPPKNACNSFSDMV